MDSTDSSVAMTWTMRMDPETGKAYFVSGNGDILEVAMGAVDSPPAVLIHIFFITYLVLWFKKFVADLGRW